MEGNCPDCLPPVDLIAGGFPCQDVSTAGKRAGIREGTRSGLWFEFHRIICELRPRFVFVENVPGLLADGMGIVLADLADAGYDAEWEVLSAGKSKFNPGLNLEVAVQKWPTPTTRDWKDGPSPSVMNRKTQDKLPAAVYQRQWPTPQTADNRDRGNLSTPAIQRRIKKGKQVMLSMCVSETSGQLNPTWVEWLMGFPTGWTDLKD